MSIAHGHRWFANDAVVLGVLLAFIMSAHNNAGTGGIYSRDL
jgi:hypothetical protein